VVATAHKIARVVYHMLKHKVEYQAVPAADYEQRFRERELKYLQRKAARLGFSLSPATAPAMAVS
jgi:transposase